MPAIADGQPALELRLPLQLQLDDAAAGHLDPVPAGADLRDVQGVGLAAVAQLDLPAHRVRWPWAGHPGPPAGTRRVPAASSDSYTSTATYSRAASAPAASSGSSCRFARSSQPVSAVPVDHLGPVQQLEQERLGGRAALDHDGGLPQRHPQPGQRLVPVPTPGDDLGDHRVVVRGDRVAGGDAGVHPDARAHRQGQQLHLARRGREPVVRVLRVEPGLDRMPEHRRARRPRACTRRPPGSAA